MRLVSDPRDLLERHEPTKPYNSTRQQLESAARTQPTRRIRLIGRPKPTQTDSLAYTRSTRIFGGRIQPDILWQSIQPTCVTGGGQ